MGIDEAIEILDTFKFRQKTKNYNKLSPEDVDAIETLVNEYNNLKQIEEAHRIENGKLREEIKDLEETLDNTWSGFKGVQEDLTDHYLNEENFRGKIDAAKYILNNC